jgi:hypothetical protein
MMNPTQRTYKTLDEAYSFFNARLFDGKLPPYLITMQRKAKARGYFSSKRFGLEDGTEVTDEIALNPSHFRERTTEQTLSTPVHEMTHLEREMPRQPRRRRTAKHAIAARAVARTHGPNHKPHFICGECKEAMGTPEISLREAA